MRLLYLYQRATFYMLTVTVSACLSPVRQISTRHAIDGEGTGRILILRSGESKLLDVTIDAFSAQIDNELVQYALEPSADVVDLQDLVDQTDAVLLFALGRRSARLATKAGLAIPLLFTMVPNYHVDLPEVGRNVMGIRLETDPLADFLKFKIVVPSLKRVLVFHSDDSVDFLNDAKTALQLWGIELELVPVTNKQDIEHEYKRLKTTVDGVWMQSDSVVMRSDVFDFLAQACIHDDIPLLTSISERLAKAGALASVGIDLMAIGSQAATMARRVLERSELAGDIGIVAPVGGRLTVNTTTAETIGVEIQSDAHYMMERVEISQTPLQ